jgi:LysM repeat protein
MNRALIFFSVLCVLTGVLRAADAISIATQQEAEERMKRLTATLEEFQTGQAAQQKQINSLASDLSKLREDVAHKDNNAATQESIRKLNEQILKVDEARIADNKRIQEALGKLAESIKALANTPAPAVRTPRPPAVEPGKSSGNPGSGQPAPISASQLGFDYIIKPGDALSVVVQKYRKEGIMVTRQSIMDANPGVDWDRLQIGKKIFIPKPAK